MSILGSSLNTYKPPGSTFNLVRKHVRLNGDSLCLNINFWVQFLREKRPFIKNHPKTWPFIDGHNRKAVNQ
jgi:hypothetical protein